LGWPCRLRVRGGEEEAFPGQNVSRKGLRRLVRQVRVRIYVFKVRRREKRVLKARCLKIQKRWMLVRVARLVD
jgi:hypothetical protein